ncbi:hypothetical protein CL618_01310 [archaeon]|nr:hypothetical protein [archaeon]
MIKIRALLLAGGYATRLYPLTEKLAKPLVSVAGEKIIDRLVKQINEICDEIIVITNDKFYEQFVKWKGDKENIKIINDGALSNDDRLGAIGDIQFVLEKEKINEDMLVIAGDNIFDFNLKDSYGYFKEKEKSVILLKKVDLEQAKKGGVVELDEDSKVVFLEEKSENPKSLLYSIPIYFYKKEDLEKVKKYLKEGNNPDAPGFYLEWLHKNSEVYGYKTEGEWFDIGDFKNLERAEKVFMGK